VRESDRGAEYAAWPRFSAQHHPMQRDASSGGVGVGRGRESDENKQSDTLLNPPRKPQIQTAAAEIVKDGVLLERLIIAVDASHYCWKGCLDTWRGPALLARIAGLHVAVGASIGILVPHRPSNYPHVSTLRYDNIIPATLCECIV
jgi:hypothetical protein